MLTFLFLLVWKILISKVGPKSNSSFVLLHDWLKGRKDILIKYSCFRLIFDWFISVGSKFAVFSSLISCWGIRGMYIIGKISSSSFDCFLRFIVRLRPLWSHSNKRPVLHSSCFIAKPAYANKNKTSSCFAKRVNYRYRAELLFFLLCFYGETTWSWHL